MPVGTSNGEYYDTDFDHEHAMMFGGRPGVYNPKTDTWEAVPAEDEKKDNKLFLVRHGDTQLNDEDRVHGWTTQPLNEKGVQQSQKAAESLSNKNITNIVSSDLPRAKQTANIISRETGAPITINPNLRTWDTGYLDGSDAKEAHDLVKKHPVDNPDTPLPGGSESFNEFKDRVISAVSDVRKNADGNTVIVSHSKPIGVIDGWEKNGFSKDGSVHMDTYEDSRCRPTTGGHQELNLPQQAAEVAAKRMKGAVLHGADQPSDIALGHGIETLAKRWDVSNIANIPSELRDEWMKDKSWGHSDFITKYMTPTGGELGGGPIGMFAGVKSVSRDMVESFSKAIGMADKGASEGEVFKATRIYQDADGNWKYILPSGDAKLLTHNMKESPVPPPDPNTPKGWSSIEGEQESRFGIPSEGVTLGQIYHNPHFYEAYPEAFNLKIYPISGLDAIMGSSGGFSRPKEYVPGKWTEPGMVMSFQKEKDFLDILHHELQHYIQWREGWQGGGSSKAFAIEGLSELSHEYNTLQNTVDDQLRDLGINRSSLNDLMGTPWGKPATAYRYRYAGGDGTEFPVTYSHLKNHPEDIQYIYDLDKKSFDFLEQHPEYIPLHHYLQNLKENIRELQDVPFNKYQSVKGEVEARNATYWAGLSKEDQQELMNMGVTPRITAHLETPEHLRLDSPVGQSTSKSESNLSNNVNRMRSEGRTWREISKELDIPLNKLYRAFRDDANYTTGPQSMYITAPDAPRKWTKEYGYPGSTKWQRAFGKLDNTNTPRNKSLDTMTDEEKLKYIMKHDK